MYDNSSVVGDAGEAVALAEFVKRGIPVLIPFGENVPYDLVIQVGSKFFRIQCKTIRKTDCKGQMGFHVCRTNGFTGERKRYADNEIDYFFFYCLENEYRGLVPVSEVHGTSKFTLRVTKPLNNQMIGIHMADDYSIENQIRAISSAG